MPARSSAEACTKISLPPRSEAIKPNPFMALYHLTVPDSSTAARSAGGYRGRSGRPRLGGSCCAVLLSTLRISRYLWPLGAGTGADLERRARRYATVAAALDHTHMQEGIARPIGELYEAEPLVGIVPFDYGLDRGTGGRFKPLGAKSGADPKLRRGDSKLSSSKPRRRVGRKSLSLLLT